MPVNVSKLLTFPASEWSEEASTFWNHFCGLLESFHPPERKFKTVNPERKWELVSAYQKAIRRGDTDTALHLCGAFACLPEQWEYFIRRMTVIAMEDVGPGNLEVAKFVVACACVYSPQKHTGWWYQISCCLSYLMTQSYHRSRVYCSLHCISAKLKTAPFEMIGSFGGQVREYIAGVSDGSYTGNSPDAYLPWCIKNDWRTDGLLKYSAIELPECLPLCRLLDEVPLPQGTMMKGLPSYAYDMYTRVGKQVLGIIHGETPQIQNLLAPVKNDKLTILGEALFFVEGGRIKNELLNTDLYQLEQKLMVWGTGLELDAWYELRAIMESLLVGGYIDHHRQDVLKKMYP